MAFPQIEGTAGSNGTTAKVTKTCSLPAGIVPGELLILLLRSAGADTHSTPAGWSALILNNVVDASDDTTSIFRRIADGNEGLSVNVPGTASLKYAAVSMRISGHNAAMAPSTSAAATGTSTAPNSPGRTPIGGAKDYLWLSLGAWEGKQASPPTYPTNYTLGQVTANSGTAGADATNCQVASAGRQLNAASEDPGAYTISASDDWSAWTIAVHPAPAGTQFSQSVGGSASWAGGLGRTTRKGLTGGYGPGGAVLRASERALAGTLSWAGTLARRSDRALAGAASWVGTLAAGVVFTKSVEGAASFVGGLDRLAQKALGGTAAWMGTLARTTYRSLAGTVSWTGETVRETGRRLVAAVSWAGNLLAATMFMRAVGGVVSWAGALVRTFQTATGVARRWIVDFADFVGRLTDLGRGHIK